MVPLQSEIQSVSKGVEMKIILIPLIISICIQYNYGITFRQIPMVDVKSASTITQIFDNYYILNHKTVLRNKYEVNNFSSSFLQIMSEFTPFR